MLMELNGMITLIINNNIREINLNYNEGKKKIEWSI